MDPQLIKPKALHPLLLKDYLLDDMSSCSSDGFKPFPRRQCCISTVRFLIEIDHKSKQRRSKYFNSNTNSPPILKNPSVSALSALRSFITAVKRLRYAAWKPPENKRLQDKPILPRSLSRQILRKSSFWKRKSNQVEIGRWKQFNQSMKESSEPLGLSGSSLSTTTKTTESAGNGHGWSGSKFTASDECHIASDEVNLDLHHDVRNDAVELMKNGGVLASSTTSIDSSNFTTTDSSTNKKEQFSPVSVLDCLFDDDEDVSSPYQHTLACGEGPANSQFDWQG